MTDLSNLTVSDLMYCIRNQYPSGVRTCNPCVKCGRTSVGAGHCRRCLSNELRSRMSGDATLVAMFESHLFDAATSLSRANDVAEAIRRVTESS